MLGARVVILMLVAWGVWRTWRGAQAQFAASAFSLGELHAAWIFASCGAYLAGTLPAAWFWFATLHALGQHPAWWLTMRAYYVGHLGKYVPGKALVVILRAAMVRGPTVDTHVAAVCVFIETLTMMAVGAVVAAALLFLQHPEQHFLTLLALALAICAGVPTLPPVFRRVIGWLRWARASPTALAALRHLDWPLVVRGWIAMTLSWLAQGLGLWATLAALPRSLLGADAPWQAMSPGEAYCLATTAVALATVAGFVSLIPGGLFVRELVVMSLLAPACGEAAAVVSAFVLRLVSLVAEAFVSSILYVAVRPPP